MRVLYTILGNVFERNCLIETPTLRGFFYEETEKNRPEKSENPRNFLIVRPPSKFEYSIPIRVQGVYLPKYIDDLAHPIMLLCKLSE